MKTVALYGTATVDRIYRMSNKSLDHGKCNEYIYKTDRYGGIFNVKRALEEKCDAGVALNFDFFIEATIYLHGDQEKTSIIKWPFMRRQRALKADWHHIMYLDKMRWVDKHFLKSLKGIVSVDLCDELVHPDQIRELAPHIDYWFMDNKNPTFEYESVITENIRGHSMIHSRNGCKIIKNNKVQHTVVNPDLSFVDILGAGDYFAAG